MHCIQALIAPKNVFLDVEATHSDAVIRPLPQSFSLIPLTEEFVANLQSAGLPALDPSVMPADEIPAGVCAFAARASLQGPVVFVATYIHGGTGGQDAVVWNGGDVTLCLHESEDDMSRWPDSSISRALRKVGVIARPKEDEFDALGLGTHRSTEGWAESCEPIFPEPIYE